MTCLLTDTHYELRSTLLDTDFEMTSAPAPGGNCLETVQRRNNWRGNLTLSFCLACESGDLRGIQDILSIDRGVICIQDSDGRTGLHLAVEHQRYEAVRILIESRADVSIRDRYGATPLHIACVRGDVRISRLLILSGADVNAQDLRGSSPLHKAAAGGFVYLCKVTILLIRIR